jgi:phosphoribosylformylglycinamidine synthase subunit PurL
VSSLSKYELNYLNKKLRRNLNQLEEVIFGAEWSEHCSYKSSKKLVKLLPTKGKYIIRGRGYDSGLIDIGENYVITVHIESHNHPSAIEPYGGASTGVGGVLRDIISTGTRPIALINSLRFSPFFDDNQKNSKSRWLFSNVVRGIADYGNCVGIPTVSGEVEFDPSFHQYCLVDVACIGMGRRENLVKNRANSTDLIIIAGNSTGKDGIMGASFASKVLQEDNRAAVQIPDPFLEKLLIEATVEAVSLGCIKVIKDLGGGGLACCLSETSDSLEKGFDVELTRVPVKEQNMSPEEIMISESQERMLYITERSRIDQLKAVFNKHNVNFAVIGEVKAHRNLIIRYKGDIVADVPSKLVAHAPLLNRPSKRPKYIDEINKNFEPPEELHDANWILLSMLSCPTIASKRWVYEQYDHEVGIRTVLRPGYGDASVLKLENGKFLAVKLDGNSKHCYLDPYNGTLGCLSEACRNVTCTGAKPIAVIDHLQFGSPEKSEVFWTFAQAIKAIVDFCKFNHIPVVGGKVSLYNETIKGAIKPSPVIGVIGLLEKPAPVVPSILQPGNSIFMVGYTNDEMGGSEYYEYHHKVKGGKVPAVNFRNDKLNRETILELTTNNLVVCAHDCSSGGLAVALSEMAILGRVGFTINIDSIPNSCSSTENLLFSESHSRYIIGTNKPLEVQKLLSAKKGLFFKEIGQANSHTLKATFERRNGDRIINLGIKEMSEKFHIIDQMMN